MAKKGDTLIEVTIAIGIFSMIAIAIASVMSSGTSGSQMALETTLTREEIDAQADALRFLHSAYVNSKRFEGTQASFDKSTNPYRKIWGSILDHVNKIGFGGTDETPGILQFTPSSCDELYNTNPQPSDPDTIFSQKAFVLNLKQLSNFQKAVVSSKNNSSSGKFVPTTTYPRVVFTAGGSATSDTQQLSNNTDIDVSATQTQDVYQAAGLYIVAVQDNNSTNISGTQTSAFYDFYIRSCWYGTDATHPSTISTVVRLYDPDIQPST